QGRRRATVKGSGPQHVRASVHQVRIDLPVNEALRGSGEPAPAAQVAYLGSLQGATCDNTTVSKANETALTSVPEEGFEPSWAFAQQILSLPSKTVPPLRTIHIVGLRRSVIVLRATAELGAEPR